jgi:hypothetical protein
MDADVEEGIGGDCHRRRHYGGGIDGSVRTRRALPRGPWVPRRPRLSRRSLWRIPSRRLGCIKAHLRALCLCGILRVLLSGKACRNALWLAAPQGLHLRLIGIFTGCGRAISDGPASFFCSWSAAAISAFKAKLFFALNGTEFGVFGSTQGRSTDCGKALSKDWNRPGGDAFLLHE